MQASRYRWFVVATFFAFILLHQADKLLIGPLTSPIMETYGIDEAQMSVVFSGAILVGAVAFPVWGMLFDLFRRTRLLALASFLWGSTTWLSAIVTSHPAFLANRASAGIDDSCCPGIYNTVADYFEPRERGKVNGILGLGQPAAGRLPGRHGAGADAGRRDRLAQHLPTHERGRCVALAGHLPVCPGTCSRRDGARTGCGRTPCANPLQLAGGWAAVPQADAALPVRQQLLRRHPVAGDHLLALPLPGGRARPLTAGHPGPDGRRGAGARRRLPDRRRAGGPFLPGKSARPVDGLHHGHPAGDDLPGAGGDRAAGPDAAVPACARPGGAVHAPGRVERDRHDLRCDRARGAQHGDRRHELHGADRVGGRPGGGRADRRARLPGDRHPRHLHRRLGHLLGFIVVALIIVPGDIAALRRELQARSAA